MFTGERSTSTGGDDENIITKRSFSMYPNVDNTCDLQFWPVNARVCKHTTKNVTSLQMNKIHVMECNKLKEG
jgi:hypothetical protein